MLDEKRRPDNKAELDTIIGQLLRHYMTRIDAVKCILMVIEEAKRNAVEDYKLSK